MADRRPRQPGLARTVAFSVLTTCLVLFGANALVEWATLSPERAAPAPGPASTFELALVGGSFARGTPWTARFGAGGIESWLEAWLELAATPAAVWNRAEGGYNSDQVLAVTRDVLTREPDALFIATCNNEGAVPPADAVARLRDLGGYRLLRDLLVSDPPTRSWYTAQHPDVAAVRDRFRANLEAMLDAAADRGVPVLLATLPVNLRYVGYEPGHVVGHRFAGATSGPCLDGIAAFEAGHPRAALPDLRACRALPPEQQPPPTAQYLALAMFQVGEDAGAAEELLAAERGAALAAGIRAFYAGRTDDALAAFERSEEVAEALKWTGLTHLAQGDSKSARPLLERSVELAPRNRCRPSFNRVIRDLAAERGGVTLVDLEGAAIAASPDGIPGDELFLDYCHMRWSGYAAMAAEVLAALERAGHVPAVARPLPPAGALAREWGLPDEGA